MSDPPKPDRESPRARRRPRRRAFVEDGIRREDITEERILQYLQELGEDADFPFLDAASREQSRQRILAGLAPGSDLWIFGYGSLMWNPALRCAEARPALLHGYHRRFCLWTPLGRGTPERPGMMLALERGGACRGMALCIAATDVDAESRIVWLREMLSDAYVPRWVRVRLAGTGEAVRAVTFVVNPGHPRYAGQVPEGEMIRAIARARGRIGRCRDYLHNLVLHLDDLGIADGPMHRLYAAVEAEAG